MPRHDAVASKYNEAVTIALAKLAETRLFYNYREGQLGTDRLRQHERSARMMAQLAKCQEGDILVIPAQVGLHYRGRSVRRAREVFQDHEFGLGSFAICCILLTHPERLVHWEQLHVDCAGDEYAPGAVGVFDRAPYFVFDGGKVRFGTNFVDEANGCYGSASAFLPPRTT
ncbi:hypothetical protein KKG41_00465 [Patescibacteria group bacterium]|nr:hypothetical protein [Patescibacteria group bacterium]MBU1890897.1 hypothetical protein [Patescibacteria group bacterium]